MANVYPSPAVLQSLQTAIQQLAAATQALTLAGGAPESVATINASIGNLQGILTTWYEVGLS